jgi:hypothetical protein
LQLAGKDTDQYSYAKGKTDLAERIEDAAADASFERGTSFEHRDHSKTEIVLPDPVLNGLPNGYIFDNKSH